jgi:hypothetical protein
VAKKLVVPELKTFLGWRWLHGRLEATMVRDIVDENWVERRGKTAEMRLDAPANSKSNRVCENEVRTGKSTLMMLEARMRRRIAAKDGERERSDAEMETIEADFVDDHDDEELAHHPIPVEDILGHVEEEEDEERKRMNGVVIDDEDSQMHRVRRSRGSREAELRDAMEERRAKKIGGVQSHDEECGSGRKVARKNGKGSREEAETTGGRRNMVMEKKKSGKEYRCNNGTLRKTVEVIGCDCMNGCMCSCTDVGHRRRMAKEDERLESEGRENEDFHNSLE